MRRGGQTRGERERERRLARVAMALRRRWWCCGGDGNGGDGNGGEWSVVVDQGVGASASYSNAQVLSRMPTMACAQRGKYVRHSEGQSKVRVRFVLNRWGGKSQSAIHTNVENMPSRIYLRYLALMMILLFITVNQLDTDSLNLPRMHGVTR